MKPTDSKTDNSGDIKKAIEGNIFCTGKESSIGGKGIRKKKRQIQRGKAVNNCPYCSDPSCKLSIHDFVGKKQ